MGQGYWTGRIHSRIHGKWSKTWSKTCIVEWISIPNLQFWSHYPLSSFEFSVSFSNLVQSAKLSIPKHAFSELYWDVCESQESIWPDAIFGARPFPLCSLHETFPVPFPRAPCVSEEALVAATRLTGMMQLDRSQTLSSQNDTCATFMIRCSECN